MSHLPRPGQVADLVEDSRIVSVVCLEERKGKLRILTESGREANVSAKQVLHVHDLHLDTSHVREALIRTLQTRAAAREALTTTINVPELWEVLKDEASDFSVVDLTELTFGTTSDDQIAAMLSALYRDRVYFRSRNERFHPTDAETVTAILTQRAREVEKLARTRRVSDWLRTAWEGEPTPPPPEGGALIEMLKEVALYGEEAQSHGQLMETLRTAGLHNEENLCFRLLVRLGEWGLNENLLLLRNGTRQEIAPEAALEAQQLSQTTQWAWQEEAREHLSGLTIYTVDSATTKDIDDALSITALPDGFEVGIHITDVAAVVSRDSALDAEARLRGTSIYLPDRHIPMLPLEISENLCSLRVGIPRPTISLFITVTEAGEIRAVRFALTVLCVDHRTTYKEVDSALTEGGDAATPWRTLLNIAKGWRAAREAAGAMFLTFPEVTITVGEQSEVSIERDDGERDSQILVSEMMIQINHLAAVTLMKAAIPCFYRGQAAPRERLFEGAAPTDLWLNYRQRMLLYRAENKTDPIFHHGLGLDAYAMTSSPLRRYTDLVNQRQLVAYLRNEPPPYTIQDLDAILADIERPVGQSSLLEQNRRRYWLLRLLETQRNLETMALVVAIYGSRIQITLPDFMLDTTLAAGSNPDIQPGQWIQVRVTRAQAMEDILRVIVVRTQVN